jgi:hypothetical protein
MSRIVATVFVSVYCVCISCVWPNPAAAVQFTHPTLGYSITFPDPWHLIAMTPEVVELLSPHYPSDAGNTLPPGNADINIRVLPGFQSNDYALDSLYQRSATRSAYSVNGREGKRLEWVVNDPTIPPRAFQWVAVAVRISDKQFLFQLEYHADDPKAAEWRQVFEGVISSLSVVGEATK